MRAFKEQLKTYVTRMRYRRLAKVRDALSDHLGHTPHHL